MFYTYVYVTTFIALATALCTRPCLASAGDHLPGKRPCGRLENHSGWTLRAACARWYAMCSFRLRNGNATRRARNTQTRCCNIWSAPSSIAPSERATLITTVFRRLTRNQAVLAILPSAMWQFTSPLRLARRSLAALLCPAGRACSVGIWFIE